MTCVIDDEEASVNEQAGMLRTNINRLRRLLQQILDFRKVESGNMKLKISHGDVATFIHNICYHNFLPLIKQQNIVFSFDAEPDRIPAYFDADKMDKIIFNLLSNAFKYTPKNGFISVRLQAKNNLLTVKVTDTGVGIAVDDLPNIFTRFYNNTLTAGETNGIGLSLTKDFVTLHRGTIAVESRLGEGTTFTIEIPIDKASYLADELSDADVKTDKIQVNDEDDDANDSDGEQTDANILFVEDNEDLLRITAKKFARHFHVYTATNGVEALDVMRNTDIDLVVSDVMMPGMDGLELCRTIKNDLHTSHIAVLLLTARNTMDDRVECYNAGADGYISKPFEMKVLKARINNFITHRKNRQQEFKTNASINISTLEYPSLDEKFLDNVIRIIEKYLSETEFDLETLAADVNMSKSSLYRKIKSMTGLSPHELIRNVKLKHACQMLSAKNIPISEVAYAVGFANTKYFTSCFKTEFGVTPTEYQKTQEVTQLTVDN
jgi:DNA-binding response OmpR family regulator/anti-sigma regulatory factor (Ser/Thr protein kinase)